MARGGKSYGQNKIGRGKPANAAPFQRTPRKRLPKAPQRSAAALRSGTGSA
jgi:hypothetical protein